MKIKSLSFKDTDTNWTLDNTRFNLLTLLVGASGVGKTQILESILYLKRLTAGDAISGISWKIEIEASNIMYRWEGEFESKGGPLIAIKDEDKDKNAPEIIFEKVYKNDRIIVDRDRSKILFNNEKTVKLSSKESIISLLKEEDFISPIYKGFQEIIFSDQTSSKKRNSDLHFELITRKEKLLKRYITIDDIRKSEENIYVKLFLAFNNVKEIADEISNRFMEVFPFVEKVKIAPLELNMTDSSSFLKDLPFIQIKEINVDKWVPEQRISSGMYRTLMHISELYLCAEGTVVLIDEFENSLGVNCIDELTSDILSSNDRDLQFIMTSHHPYIINNIHHNNWKIVTRKGSTVRTHDVSDFADFSQSKHTAFVQLTQLDEFKTGIE